MKKILLLCLSIAVSFGAMAQVAQVAQHLPNGFRRANVPAALKNYNIKVPYRAAAIDNGAPLANQMSIPHASARLSSLAPTDEILIGGTFYDLQTNNSISNRLVVNNDKTVCAAWTFSPDAISTSTPPYPNRGSGYNYYNGSSWLYPAGPSLRQEGTIRTGFTNMVVTPSGAEMLIAHNAVAATDSNQIAVTRRAAKGTGAWTTTFPWGHAYDTWPKAVAGGTGNSQEVYVVFQGSGAAASTTAPPHIVANQNGPLFFARSDDDGLTWTPKKIITEIDSDYYAGFGGDCYSIDARGDTVAISYADTYTDVGLLVSHDRGNTWTKYIIQKHPIPFYANCNCNTNYIPDVPPDTIIDTVYSNGGDSKVLIDNTGRCHVWFSEFDYHDSDGTDNLYNPHDGSDNLLYWNTDMPQDTGGARSYVAIASTQDFNNNGVIDAPVLTFPATTCTNRNPWGDYGGGLTQMPSAGIDDNGKIYLTYQAIDEVADTASWHALHRHIYMMTLAPTSGYYDPYNWTYPYDIIPDTLSGGYGEFQEGVFACTGRKVDDTYAYVEYQRDDVPGHGLAANTTCDYAKNFGNSSDIILCRVDISTVGVLTANANDLFVSQNYPNPATGTTYFNVGLKKSSSVKIEVYDLIGKAIFSESKGLLSAGSYTFTLNTSGWETGVYTYSVIANGEKTTRRMIVQ